jgi:hypothetical protein
MTIIVACSICKRHPQSSLVIATMNSTTLGYLKPMIELEANSIREYAIKPITVMPKSCEFKRDPTPVNYLTVDSNYDVSKIKSVLISDTKKFPHQPDTLVVTVLEI